MESILNLLLLLFLPACMFSLLKCPTSMYVKNVSQLLKTQVR